MNDDFYKAVEEEILSLMPESYKDYTVRIDEVNKSGDVKMHGISLIKGNSGAAPILYLDPYKEMYEQGIPKDHILKNIADTYCEIVKKAPVVNMPDMSFESIKDDLRVRLVYNRTNYDYLKQYVHKDVGCGYCLVVYADFSDKLFDGAIVNIRKDMLDKFGFDERVLIDAAIEGSVKHCPAKLTYITDELFSLMSDREKENLLEKDKIDLSRGILVLTTEDRFAGAATMFYPGVLEKAGKLIDWDYFVLPSSIHEVLLIPADGRYSARDLAQMVKSVNSAEVSREEQLGNRVLFYDRVNEQLCVLCDLDRGKNREDAR